MSAKPVEPLLVLARRPDGTGVVHVRTCRTILQDAHLQHAIGLENVLLTGVPVCPCIANFAVGALAARLRHGDSKMLCSILDAAAAEFERAVHHIAESIEKGHDSPLH